MPLFIRPVGREEAAANTACTPTPAILQNPVQATALFNAARARPGFYYTINQVNPIHATPEQEQATQTEQDPASSERSVPEQASPSNTPGVASGQ